RTAVLSSCFFFLLRLPRGSSRFPYTTLFRSLFHDVELGLPSQDPAHLAVGPELGVFLLRRAHRLVVPFRQRRRGLELDGEPGVGEQAHVAAAGYPFLVVPQTDEGSGPVPTVADRVGVDRAGNPRRP